MISEINHMRRALALARRGGYDHTIIDFIGEIKDEYGTTIQNVRDTMDIKLSDATAAELAKRPIQYDTGYTLLPGGYKIKLLARDAETGNRGRLDNQGESKGHPGDSRRGWTLHRHGPGVKLTLSKVAVPSEPALWETS